MRAALTLSPPKPVFILPPPCIFVKRFYALIKKTNKFFSSSHPSFHFCHKEKKPSPAGKFTSFAGKVARSAERVASAA